jgi:DNA-binding NarL/FixJ family response regulator
MPDIRVIVVDDHAFTRTTVADSLRIHGVDVVETCGTANEAIQGAATHNPDVMVIDLNLGQGPSGLDLATGLRKRNPHLGVVILTSYSDPRLMSNDLPPLPAGALYLVKQDIIETETLAKAVMRAHESSRSSRGSGNHSKRLELTDGQVEVLRLMSEGLSNGEIARRRGVKEKAIEQTISRIAKRLELPAGSEVNQRAQLVRAYFELTGTQRV